MSISLSLEAIFLRYKNEELPEFVCLELNDVNQSGNFGKNHFMWPACGEFWKKLKAC